MPMNSAIGVLFSDICNSSRMYEQLGNDTALRLVQRCYSLQRDVITSSSGKIIKTIGDEVMATFSQAEDMFDAAIAMQKAAEHLHWPDKTQNVQFRIGLHYGDALFANDDVFGETVNTAAHLTRIAKAEQIVTTVEVAEQLDPKRRLSIRDLGHFPVKGRPDGLHALEVLWKSTHERTVFSPGRSIAPRTARSRLKLEYGGAEWTYNGDRVVTLGRDPTNDIVVPTSATSRKHATVELRGDKWVLSDRSANGTFLRFGAADVIWLHCEEAILHDHGTLGMGQSPTGFGPESVAFALLDR